MTLYQLVTKVFKSKLAITFSHASAREFGKKKYLYVISNGDGRKWYCQTFAECSKVIDTIVDTPKKHITMG